MVDLAEIFRHYGPAYREQFGDRMPASHLQAMADIEACRTEALGGQVYYCPACEETRYHYHSCPGALVSRPDERSPDLDARPALSSSSSRPDS